MALQYGVSLPQGWIMDLARIKDPMEAYEALTRVAQTADELGYSSVWLADHFHTVPQPVQEKTFECWTATAALARDTKRVRISQVTCNGYRNPALLAHMASTVDVLSHGRLNFGIGAGWYEHEYRAYGYEYPDTAERLRRLGEAVQVVLAMWTQDDAVFEGRYYQVRGAINQPKGIQLPHIPLLIAGSGEQVTLRLVAQYGDACNIYGDAETVKRKLAVLRAHCAAVGREYERIHRTGGAMCAIAATEEQAQAKMPAGLAGRPTAAGALIGTPDMIRRRLEELEVAGIQEVVLGFPDVLDLEPLRFFAREFIG
jgi:F420-dependent oxidoreductase-like protein